MSYQDGWAALNLEMPDRVPRTEYSVDGYHFALMRRVTGIPVTAESPAQERLRAAQAFRKAWAFDFAWSTLIANQIYKGFCTNMGHASYAAAGSDYDDALYCPFEDPEDVLAFDPWEAYGPIDLADMTRQFEEHYRANAAAYPDEVNMTGIYTTLMSGLIAVFGWDMLHGRAGVWRSGQPVRQLDAAVYAGAGRGRRALRDDP